MDAELMEESRMNCDRYVRPLYPLFHSLFHFSLPLLLSLSFSGPLSTLYSLPPSILTDIKTGLNSRATGSSYIELGTTKVICAM